MEFQRDGGGGIHANKPPVGEVGIYSGSGSR